ncbi:WYL domain-containing protein [Fulvivirgaceae bacterium BMA10]|uniref:WYL domain-containing protein n=1 Tax=Splendidivirga corallicola TaxID=3051826 RepID=A0ABT8KWN7_9BACT|nr:WYL domain-containing protein [Fulvivirgaceae bacterium BMA10]
MPVNRNALIRYKTIDNCLRNRYRRWTLDDLIDACSDALYEYEGIDKGVSKRTVQMDIQFMRSDKLGYNAPIIVVDKKYYTYEDKEYSITNIPLTDQDLNKLSEVIEILRQFKGFSHFQELSGMVQRLEDKVHTEKTKQDSVIDFETNEHLKGLDFIDDLYQAIIHKRAVSLTYQSFKARSADTFNFHPQLLKEFRNRWFVLGFKNNKQLPLLLALDRLISIEDTSVLYVENTTLNLKEYFKQVIGVSVEKDGNPEYVEVFVENGHAPYILTKPLHHSQKIVKKQPGGVIISIKVQLNFELEKELLGYGETIKVLKPDRLVRRLKKRIALAHDHYTQDLHPTVAKEIIKQVQRKGHATLEHVFKEKEIAAITGKINAYLSKQNQNAENRPIAIRQLLSKLPELKPLLFNSKMYVLIKSGLGKNYFLSKAIYFDKPAKSNWYVTSHQDITINVQKKLNVDGFTGWTKKDDTVSVCPPLEYLRKTVTFRLHLDPATKDNGALQVIPNSHHKVLNDEEIQFTKEKLKTVTCEMPTGGVHFMKPLTIHSSQKTINQKSRKVIHLEFCCLELPEELEWAEKVMLS